MIFVDAATNKEAWSAFRRELYHVTEEFDEKDMEAIMMDDSRESFLVVIDDQYAGMLELSMRSIVDGCLTSPVAYIEGIIVKSELRGKAFGERLVQWAKEWGRSKGCSELGSDAELDNIDSQNFHKAIGFEETYRTVGYRMEL